MSAESSTISSPSHSSPSSSSSSTTTSPSAVSHISTEAVSLEGPTINTIGAITREYVSTPYGRGRLILPHAPREDGICVVQLQWCTLYTQAENITRLKDYKPSKAEIDSVNEKLQVKTHNLQPHGSDGHRKNQKSGAGSSILSSPVVEKISNLMTTKAGFAPLAVPMSRRRQTLAVAVSTVFSLICVIVSILCIRSSNIFIFYPFLAYLIYIFFFQTYHCDGYGLRWEFYRRIGWWRWFRDYFPISLHRTAVLDPKGKYVFGYHPHGILSLGAFLNFGTEATGFSEKFPGIRLTVMTLTSNFRIPFYGIFVSWMGIADASRESCNNTLRRGPGSAIVLVLGGAKESLDAHPDRDYELTLHRKGFVKVALENQADLVPVFSFGETDVWDQVDNPRGSLLRTIQEKMQHTLGFAIPLIKGRGVWNYSFGVLAHRRPIVTFVGAPLILPKITKADITDELINEYHSKYQTALEELFNKYADTFAPHRKLIFAPPPKGSRGSKRTPSSEVTPPATKKEQ